VKIYIAGHNGLVGSAIARKLETSKKYSWVGKSRSELDLLDKSAVFEFISNNDFDAIILAAAKVGGIKANMDFPVEFLSENLQIQLNIINAAHASGVKKLFFLGSSCIYPKFADQPIKEESLLTGALEETNEPYALAKIAGIKLIQAYRKEYGHEWISGMPTNLYGPNDNFNIETSHVLPALIAKFHQAKLASVSNVKLWGTGKPRREFLHVDDLASASLFLLENYNSDLPINIGTGEDLEISELAEIIAKVTNFKGSIIWDKSMPDGTPRKLLDVTRINELGWKSNINITDGIESTYEWYLAKFHKSS
jgi:GDP-L-fucose synthase